MMDKPYMPSRPGMVQPASEQGVFEPETMRKELGGMAPVDLEAVPPMPKKSKSRRPPMPPKKSAPPKGMAKGGSVRRADGCAQRGHTKGKMR